MTVAQEYRSLLSDLTEAVAQAFDVVCAAVICGDSESPVHFTGDELIGQRFTRLPSVSATLNDGHPRTEEPPLDGTMEGAVLIGIEPLSILPEEPTTVIVFAIRQLADSDRAVALVHALAAETASELMLLKHASCLGSALAEVECGVTIVDPNIEDSPLIYANDAFARMTGYERSEVLGQNMRFLQGGFSPQPGIHKIRDALERGLDCTTVLTNFRRNGEPFQNRLRLRPIRASDGTISHIIGIQFDVTAEQSALASLERQRCRYQSLVEAEASYIWHMNTAGEIQEFDQAWLALAGVSPGGQPPDLSLIRNVLTSEAAEAFRHRWIDALQKIEPFEVVYQLPADSESPRWLLDRVTPVRDDEGNLLEWLCVSQDITGLKRAEQDLYRIIEAAPTGMLVVDAEGRITLANTQAGLMFGYGVEDLVGLGIEALVPERSRQKHSSIREAFFDSLSVQGIGMDRELKALRQDGHEFDAEIGLSWFGQGEQCRVIAAIQDMTELREARDALERAAYEDRLTGLLSQEGFAWELDERRAAEALHPASLIVSIDIAGLREINNAQGYEVGDQVLREVACRLEVEAGEQDLVARPGGGEFLVLGAVDKHRTPGDWRQRLEAAFDTPFQVNDFALFLSAAFGYVRIGKKSRDVQTLINDAELALRQSQQNPAVTWTQHTRVLEDRTRKTVRITRQLRQALEQNELMLYYQPKVDLSSGCIASAEALLRWHHAEQGFIPPGEFIPLAEQSQLIGPIGEWVLRQACRDLKAWSEAGLEVKPISVNVSLIQFQLGRVPELVQRTLDEFGITPGQLTLEITESVFEQYDDSLKRDLHTLSAMGVKLSLDDFGTGYSSLSYLKNYPFGEIKIDKSFVWQLDDGIYGQAIVKAVEAIAQAIGANIVAEGVETAHHAETLKALGCAFGQGFYYNQALPELSFRQLLAHQSGSASTFR